jgi:hypothetical protein
LLALALSNSYSTVFYLDADATIVHSRSLSWLNEVLQSTMGHDLVLTKDGEGPDALIYEENGQGRLNDATFINTGVLLLRNADRKTSSSSSSNGGTVSAGIEEEEEMSWMERLLVDWWAKADEMPVYRQGRTYDQGALGHLFFAKSAQQKQPPQGASEEERRSFQQRNAERAAWRRRVGIVEPEVMNNHAPGGSFKKQAQHAHGGDARSWWCDHFAHPVLQMSGQSEEVRRRVLRRVWREGSCQHARTEGASTVSVVVSSSSGEVMTTAAAADPEEGNARTCSALGK